MTGPVSLCSMRSISSKATEKTTRAKPITGTTDPNLLNRDFTFTVRLTDEDGKPLAGEYSYTKSTVPDKAETLRSGDSITLKNGQTITIADLPVGSKYTITETPVSGFTPNGEGTGQNQWSGEVKAEGSAVSAVNNYTPDPPKDPDNPNDPNNPDGPNNSDGPAPGRLCIGRAALIGDWLEYSADRRSRKSGIVDQYGCQFRISADDNRAPDREEKEMSSRKEKTSPHAVKSE